ncbi:MAG: hypothetical protein EP330_12430 [Deltaproteobacteria bacterium]|nr:MAG: hypothetical protein EP330_12430 [Deltaproteobacteria bacterium]
MRPIRDIDELATGAVLHHSAFGFAEVRAIDEEQVALSWESDDANLPASVSVGSLRKAWTLCAPEGFFARAMLDRETLAEQLQVDPPAALKLLLTDLGEPQRKSAISEWLTGRRLISGDAFDRWWVSALPAFRQDAEIRVEGDSVSLEAASQDDLRARLRRTESPGERLELALAHRADLDVPFVDEVVFAAWIAGSSAVRERALAAVADHSPETVVHGLLDAGGDPTEALIHAVRNAGWQSDDLSEDGHLALSAHLLRRLPADVPLDAEGRLAATLVRWGSPTVEQVLSECAGSADGQRLVRATANALPTARAAELIADLFARAIDDGAHQPAQWLCSLLLDGLDVPDDQMMALIEARGDAFRRELASHHAPVAMVEEEGMTAELDLSALVTEPILLTQLQQSNAGLGFIAVGLAVARGLSAAHHRGDLLNPTRSGVWLMPDGTVEFRETDERARRIPGEPPSPAGDLYSAALLLVEALLGRPLPNGTDPSLAIPYIRGAVPDLPPSALAPLDAALHPEAQMRPRDGLAWLLSWQACAIAEDERMQSKLDPKARLDVGYDSHVGRMKILYTQTNQDALFVAERSGVTLLVVCDGISTATAGSGDVAAGITAHVVSSLWEQALSRLKDASIAETEDFLSRAFRMANQAVCEAALRFAGGRLQGRVPMGTTAVVAIARGNRITLAWLGDSRAYVVGPYGSSLLTADMNQAGDRMIGWSRGDLGHWDANGYALVGYIGHFDESYTAVPLQPALIDLHLLPGERLVICSDGVTDYAAQNHPETANRIGRAVLGRPCDEAARALVELANRGGGGDNATAVVACLREG